MPISYEKVKGKHGAYTREHMADWVACAQNFDFYWGRETIITPNQRKFANAIKDNRNVFLKNGLSMFSIIPYMIWYCTFNRDLTASILCANNHRCKEVMDVIKIEYESMRDHLKPCVTKYDTRQIDFDNGCSIFINIASPDALRGMSVQFLVFDNFCDVDRKIQIDTYSNSIISLMQFNNPRPNPAVKCILTADRGNSEFLSTIVKQTMEGRTPYIIVRGSHANKL
jgi:hypothetical protein